MKYFCGTRAGGLGLVQFKCSVDRKEGYLRDVYHVENHSRLTRLSAYDIFKSSLFTELSLDHARDYGRPMLLEVPSRQLLRKTKVCYS